MPLSAPVLLVLDTATDRIHAALAVGDAVGDAACGDVTVLDLAGGAQASATLLPALAGLLHGAGLVWADLDAIAFGSGPGAFTGLRTACSVTQGLALGLDRRVISLDTLMAVAEDARLAAPHAWSAGDTLWVLQDARMNELYVGAFVWDGGAWQSVQPAQLWALSEPATRWAPDGVLAAGLRWAGNAAHAYPEVLAAIVGAQQMGASASHAAPRGLALASLARQAWLRGDTLDAALALPRYVRDKVAQTTAERQAIKA
ncbi:MAG: tRNA (adenosine(37)-N6)-threonylcarbamoyltransferase complex dimerization subunit type 1 TsaB [Aquabacterium sp.]|nr:tRNA (adenosine(37)-N6)-threonylcarbamoyltransferase complex dimerization subunit type 1 TsaB [Aquabacterium sp.]